jgi:hypothetical protein
LRKPQWFSHYKRGAEKYNKKNSIFLFSFSCFVLKRPPLLYKKFSKLMDFKEVVIFETSGRIFKKNDCKSFLQSTAIKILPEGSNITIYFFDKSILKHLSVSLNH